MQLPRVDPPPPGTYATPLPRARVEERRESVTEPASLVQVAPVARRLGNDGRDPTLDPTRQRRERGDNASGDAPHRGANPSTSPPRPQAAPAAREPSSARASTEASVTVRAFELIAQTGRARIASADLPNAGEREADVTVRSGGVAGGHVHTPNCAYCKAGLAVYKRR